MAVIDLSGILPQSFDRCAWTPYCKLGPWSNGAFRSTLFSFCGAHVEGYGHFDIMKPHMSSCLNERNQRSFCDKQSREAFS